MCPQSIAEMSAYMVSMTMDCCQRGMLSVGNGEYKFLVKWVSIDVRTYSVVVLDICLIVSIGCQVKCGMNVL